MNIGQRIWGKSFKGQKIVSVLNLPGVHMGYLSNGRMFILRTNAGVTVR